MNSTVIIFIVITAYLLIGCLVMLVATEFSYGIVTRKEFLRGMLIWPLAVVLFFEHFLSAYWGRLRSHRPRRRE